MPSCKISYQDVTRKVQLTDKESTWAGLTAHLQTLFGATAPFALKYTDGEGDKITLNTDQELADLWPVLNDESTLKLELVKQGPTELDRQALLAAVMQHAAQDRRFAHQVKHSLRGRHFAGRNDSEDDSDDSGKSTSTCVRRCKLNVHRADGFPFGGRPFPRPHHGGPGRPPRDMPPGPPPFGRPPHPPHLPPQAPAMNFFFTAPPMAPRPPPPPPSPPTGMPPHHPPPPPHPHGHFERPGGPGHGPGRHGSRFDGPGRHHDRPSHPYHDAHQQTHPHRHRHHHHRNRGAQEDYDVQDIDFDVISFKDDREDE